MNGPTPTNPSQATEKPSLGRLARETFRRDLPRLLKERPGQWVAYHGDQLVGLAKTDLELYQLCIQRGYRGQDYTVRCIEPEPPEIVDSPYPFD
jgi:hypothetical protein